MWNRRLAHPLLLVLLPAAVLSTFEACVEPPPKIAAIPVSGLSLRVYVFGATAEEARRAFEAVKQNNKSFSVVKDGGDGEVLVGLENDSPKCVPPTGLCSFRVSYRIRDNAGNVVSASSTNVSATADSCSALCEKAINNVAVKVVEVAAGVLKGDGNGPVDSGIPAEADAEVTTPVDAGSPSPDASAPVPRGSKKPRPKAEAPPPPKPDPLICSVGAGSRLPTAEAEKRAAQVEILKRLNVLDQDEYDCLRKAYLSRL